MASACLDERRSAPRVAVSDAAGDGYDEPSRQVLEEFKRALDRVSGRRAPARTNSMRFAAAKGIYLAK